MKNRFRSFVRFFPVIYMIQDPIIHLFFSFDISRTILYTKLFHLFQGQKQERIEEELEADIEPLTRAERIRQDTEALNEVERYRIEEFETIAKQLNKFFSLDFEVDHAFALLNPFEAGKHHPDNLQLLIKAHNGKKNKKNWQRFTLEEQKAYIQQVIALQTMIASRLEISLVDDVLDSLLERLGKVY